ncbi:MAG: hypothetical protein JWO82_1706, partial [Akkermansiaceae bacterium]|nr:hypothetical protein [Akkermansiaceae bacterium]
MNSGEEPATAVSPRSVIWRGKSWIVLVTILIVGMAALMGVREWGIRGDIQRWERYRAEWEAKGEDFGTARWMPPLVANSNDNFAAHSLIAGIWTSAASVPSVKLASLDTLTLPGMGGEQPGDSEESWYAEHPDRARAFLTALEP